MDQENLQNTSSYKKTYKSFERMLVSRNVFIPYIEIICFAKKKAYFETGNPWSLYKTVEGVFFTVKSPNDYVYCFFFRFPNDYKKSKKIFNGKVLVVVRLNCYNTFQC